MGRAEEEKWFRELFDRHHHALVAYFMRRIANRADALDAAEDVLLVAWRRRDKVPGGEAELPWLYGVARNVLANHRRANARRFRLRRKIAEEPMYPPRDTASEAVLAIEEQQLLEALATLREKDREVLLLTYWEHLSHKDIGRILGCTTEAVHVRRYRAVKRLGNAFRHTGHKPAEGKPIPQQEGSRSAR